jgi:hypothetical protein
VASILPAFLAALSTFETLSRDALVTSRSSSILATAWASSVDSSAPVDLVDNNLACRVVLALFQGTPARASTVIEFIDGGETDGETNRPLPPEIWDKYTPPARICTRVRNSQQILRGELAVLIPRETPAGAE